MPSPKFRTTLLMLAVAATATVKLVGTPAATSPLGGVMLMPVRGLIVTVAVAVLPAALAVTIGLL